MEKKYTVQPIKKWGPILNGGLMQETKDTKDPCILFDGTKWHIYGSSGTTISENWKLLHATADSIEGPWKEVAHVDINISGGFIAAPSVMYDAEEKKFHMFVQTDFTKIGGTIEHLISDDGMRFEREDTALAPLPGEVKGSPEAGLYDPHVSIIKGQKFMVYSGIPHPGNEGSKPRPDVFVAKSEGSWEGPWKRCGRILAHEDISWHHNQHDHPEYEWGIEGPQLVELPSGLILLNATCFLPHGRFGTRQRVFFAIGESVDGPFKSLGPVISDSFDVWESGENGHASAVVQGNILYLFYQARSGEYMDNASLNDWKYGIAPFDIAKLEDDFRKA